LPARRTLKLVIEYDGSGFHGWQVQTEERTVQGELEAAFERITHEKLRIQGAGRTDAGVHAFGQAGSLTTGHAVGTRELRRGLNALTGDDVAVRSIEEVEPGFCARRSATGKLYRYRILNAEEPSPLRRRTLLHVARPLDLGAMAEAAALLEGRHDFAAFRASDCERDNTVVTMESCRVIARGDEICLEVRAPAFLKNMVRIMAGTLLEAGRGRMTAGDVGDVLASADRRNAGPTAPAHGLVLVEVYYGPRPAPTTSSIE
jgi:tRNA pseudouridine38-40 synthase